MADSLPTHPVFRTLYLSDDDLLNFHLKYPEDTRMVYDATTFSQITTWANQCIGSGRYELEYVPDVDCGIADDRIIDWINKIMPNDEYICFYFSTAIYLKNYEILKKMIKYIEMGLEGELGVKDADYTGLLHIESITGLNSKTFIWNENSTSQWSVYYPKKSNLIAL
jgi:hypothetical protein